MNGQGGAIPGFGAFPVSSHLPPDPCQSPPNLKEPQLGGMGGEKKGTSLCLPELITVSLSCVPSLRTVQCKKDGGSCWCVDADGREVPGSRQPGRPVACKWEGGTRRGQGTSWACHGQVPLCAAGSSFYNQAPFPTGPLGKE